MTPRFQGEHPTQRTGRGRRPADPRIAAGARALADVMGTPKDWEEWVPEVRAVLEAADSIDPYRKETA